MSARALIFHMSIPFEKTFPLVPTFVTLNIWLNYIMKTLILLLTLEQWVQSFDNPQEYSLWQGLSVNTNFFTFWPWPLSLAYFLKTLTLLITFQHWMPQFSYMYFTWIFLMIRSFLLVLNLLTMTFYIYCRKKKHYSEQINKY